MADQTSPLAPLDPFPERTLNQFEAKTGPNVSGQTGPARFYEGVASDTDVPNCFVDGMRDGYDTGARPNQNAVRWIKDPGETMRERAHVGSASWVEGPDYLGAFAGGTSNEAERKFIVNDVGENRKERQSPAVVRD